MVNKWYCSIHVFLYARLQTGRIKVWWCPSVRPSVRPSQFSALFSYMLWDIELKFCISLYYDARNSKFKCRQFLMELCPFLAHLSRRLKWAIVIAHRPSSVRPSVRPSSVRKLSHFRLLLWNRWTEFNETWQEARSQRPLPSLCFSGRSEKQDGRPGLWLAETFSTSPLKPLNGI